ncbi:NADPH:quinone oxidoreductase family protein [Paracoccus sp. Z118]|uniref:NADPH:quinone oxidoreductase family protein n=1 Tax=Paracoccus sp. Z118 TaxID=2851017 RepID=UPI001C2C06C8|nr:NADPH:quinone oxidoreductase family protein [Paracoccus sp. Z118]MBV0893017.1 NADPH:quinone oxidoreductase family protein [Paracoccus sp. Z118]
MNCLDLAPSGSHHALIIASKGAAPALSEQPNQPPGPGQVQVRLRAAALNFADLLMVDGRYQDTPPYPFVPGLEGAGEIEALGPGIAPALGLAVGQRVAVAQQGTLAERGIFDAGNCLPIPDTLGWEAAAGFPIAYGTSHLALTSRANLQAGETLAVLGAGGGVGLTAVEIGAAMGARVIAIARGGEKLAAARAAGAAETIDSDAAGDLRAALKALGGCDVVYDPVGDAPGLAAFGALRPGGRFLVIGFAGGKPPVLPLNHALVKNIAIHGFYWGGYRSLDPAALRGSLLALFGMQARGLLRPHVGAVLPLTQAAEAYALLKDRKVTGKVVLTI